MCNCASLIQTLWHSNWAVPARGDPQCWGGFNATSCHQFSVWVVRKGVAGASRAAQDLLMCFRSRLYMADLESGLHFLLRVELATHKALEGAELKTFKDFVTISAKVGTCGLWLFVRIKWLHQEIYGGTSVSPNGLHGVWVCASSVASKRGWWVYSKAGFEVLFAVLTHLQG